MTDSQMFFDHVVLDSLFRGLELVSFIVLLGWQGFLALVFRPEEIREGSSEIRGLIIRFERRLTIGALWVVVLAMAAEFGHESMEMSRRSLSEVGPFLWPVLTRTHFGQVLIGQLLLVAAFAWIWSRRGKVPDGLDRGRGALLVVGALLCLTESLTGHAADQGNWSVDVLVDWLHLLAVSFWAGGLVPLAALVPPLLKRCEPGTARAVLIRTIERFSSLAMSCVAVLIAAGLFSAHRRGVVWLAPFESTYGELVGLKVALTAVAVALGGFSKFIILPCLRRGSAAEGMVLSRNFRRAIAIEVGVVAIVLIVAAVLTQWSPPGKPSAAAPMDHSRMEHSPAEHSMPDSTPH